MRFFASSIFVPNGSRPVDSDADGDGAPDYLELNVGMDPRIATRDAVRTALVAGRALLKIEPAIPHDGITSTTDSDSDGIPDLEELRCGSNPLDRSDSRPGCPAFPAEPR